MRTRIGTILIAVVALVVGVAAGWLAGRASTPNVPDARASVPRAPEQSTRTSGVGAHRPAANVVDKPRHAAVKVNADERREADTAKQEEKPVQVAQSFRARTTRSWCVRHARKTRRFSSAFAQSRNVFE